MYVERALFIFRHIAGKSLKNCTLLSNEDEHLLNEIHLLSGICEACSELNISGSDCNNRVEMCVETEKLLKLNCFVTFSQILGFVDTFFSSGECDANSNEIKAILSSLNFLEYYFEDEKEEKSKSVLAKPNFDLPPLIPQNKDSPAQISTPLLQQPVQTSRNLTSSQLEIFKIFCSYFELLLNSRNEIALARALNVPCRDLDHEAFTSLKKMAKQKQMPMFQTACSFVLRLRVAKEIGKSTTLNMDCSLLEYKKGLTDFVDLIQKLQTIFEDISCPIKAAKAFVKTLKKAFLSSPQFSAHSKSLDKVSRLIVNDLESFVDRASHLLNPSPKANGDGGSVLGRKTKKALRCWLDLVACCSNEPSASPALGSPPTGQITPAALSNSPRFPSLASLFRSPAVTEDDENVQSTDVDDKMNDNNGKENRDCLVKHFQVVKKRNTGYIDSFMDWATESQQKAVPLMTLSSNSSRFRSTYPVVDSKINDENESGRFDTSSADETNVQRTNDESSCKADIARKSPMSETDKNIKDAQTIPDTPKFFRRKPLRNISNRNTDSKTGDKKTKRKRAVLADNDSGDTMKKIKTGRRKIPVFSPSQKTISSFFG